MMSVRRSAALLSSAQCWAIYQKRRVPLPLRLKKRAPISSFCSSAGRGIGLYVCMAWKMSGDVAWRHVGEANGGGGRWRMLNTESGCSAGLWKAGEKTAEMRRTESISLLLSFMLYTQRDVVAWRRRENGACRARQAA